MNLTIKTQYFTQKLHFNLGLGRTSVEHHKADLVLDVPGSVGILECIKCLHEVSVGGANAGYHQSAAIPSERVLE